MEDRERTKRFLDEIERRAREIKEEATGFAEASFRAAAIDILADVILIREELDIRPSGL